MAASGNPHGGAPSLVTWHHAPSPVKYRVLMYSVDVCPLPRTNPLNEMYTVYTSLVLHALYTSHDQNELLQIPVFR